MSNDTGTISVSDVYSLITPFVRIYYLKNQRARYSLALIIFPITRGDARFVRADRTEREGGLSIIGVNGVTGGEATQRQDHPPLCVPLLEKGTRVRAVAAIARAVRGSR